MAKQKVKSKKSGSKQSSGSITRAEFEKLGKSLHSVAEQVARNTRDIPEIKRSLDSFRKEMREDLSSVREDLSSVREDLSSVREDLSSVREDFGSLHEEVGSLRGSVIGIENHMQELVAVVREGLSPRLSKQDQRLDDHESRIHGLEEKV